MLRLLCKHSTRGFKKLLEECILPLLKNCPKLQSSSGMLGFSDGRSLYGYAGIKNLGCICYMNAMLQQFFMCPAFR